ncbi:MAG: hypothetical protein JWN70_6249 [Planctomycetaceae bacterium]|nr:hypothetical protein [Planctomycetaceae bacterium]
MKQHLNLLPIQLRRRTLLRTRLRQWGFIWATMCAVAILLLGRSWYVLSAAYGDLATWERRASGVQAVHEQNERLRVQIEGLRRRLAKYGDLNSEQIGLKLLATVSQSSAKTSGSHQIQKLSFNQTLVADAPVHATPNAATTATPPKTREVRALVLSGVAKSNITIAEFVSTLRDSGVFQKVDLKSSQGNKTNTKGPRQYQVECTF